MLIKPLILCIARLLSSQVPEAPGRIDGVVLNVSRDGRPVPAADVLLRAAFDGEFLPVARIQADAQGRFSFTDLPVDQGITYLPGATLDDIHYPGARIELTPARRHAQVRLTVQDVISAPSPLLLSDYQIFLESEAGALRVTEQLLIENPQPATYVGFKPSEDGQPVTLQLRIPSGFEKVTFHEEFYGRRFALIDGVPTTSIPWPTGQRIVRFTYVVRDDNQHRLWTRPLDLPCRRIQLHVRSDLIEQIETNLVREPMAHDGLITFSAGQKILPVGHSLQVRIKNPPLPFMAYARWIVLTALMALLVGILVLVRLRSRTARPGPKTPLGHPGPKPAASIGKNPTRNRRERRVPRPSIPLETAPEPVPTIGTDRPRNRKGSAAR